MHINFAAPILRCNRHIIPQVKHSTDCLM